MTSLARSPGLAALLAGGSPAWRDLRMSADELIAMCAAEELSPLVHQQLHDSGVECDWPESVVAAVAARAREAAGEELLRAAEARAVVAALAAAGVRALLIKGTPLAYSVYPAPAARPREDTDLLVPAADAVRARAVLASLGFTSAVSCDRLFAQFDMQKVDRFGVTHAYDVHWRISTQAVFAGVLTHEEMWPRAVAVPALGPAAMTPSIADALLLACIHPVMHHQNSARALWLFDVFLLASRLSAGAAERFVELARARKVAAVCAHQLRLVQHAFRTPIAAGVVSALADTAADEPSARYLASNRRWHHEMIASMRGLPAVGDRVRLVRDVLLPSPGYMLGAYGLRDNALGPWLLPALYVHRNVRGAWKILTGRK